MGKDIMPRGDRAVALTRAAAKQYNELQSAAFFQRSQMEAQEQNMAFRADRRIENGYTIASRLVQNAGQLSHEITNASRDNPGLEMLLRGVEVDVAQEATAVLKQYMRPSW